VVEVRHAAVAIAFMLAFWQLCQLNFFIGVQ